MAGIRHSGRCPGSASWSWGHMGFLWRANLGVAPCDRCAPWATKHSWGGECRTSTWSEGCVSAGLHSLSTRRCCLGVGRRWLGRLGVQRRTRGVSSGGPFLWSGGSRGGAHTRRRGSGRVCGNCEWRAGLSSSQSCAQVCVCHQHNSSHHSRGCCV